MDDENLMKPEVQNNEEEIQENSLRPQRFRWIYRSNESKRKYESMYWGGQKNGWAFRPLFVLWTSRSW